MEILVNSKKIDFTLEDERNVSDIVKDLEKWINENNNVISSIKVNNKNIGLDELNSFSMDIDSVKKIEVVTKNKIDLAFESIDTTLEYLSFIQDSLKGDLFENNDLILDGLSWIYESIELIVKILNLNEYFLIYDDQDLSEIMGKIHSLVKEYSRKFIDEKGAEEIGSTIDRLKYIMIKMYKWGIVKNYKVEGKAGHDLTLIKEIMSDYVSVCRKTLDKFDATSESLQVGDDIDAFNGILYISSILSESVDIIGIIKNLDFGRKKSIYASIERIDSIFTKITENLKLIEESFRNEDMITIGDILEYELKPLFEDLIVNISKINNFIVD